MGDSAIDRRKAAARRDLNRLRASIPEDAREKIDAAICARVIEMPRYKKAEVILTYLSFGTEVSTWPLIRRAWADGKCVCIPRCEPGTREMRWYVVTSFDDLVPSPHGMHEPDPEALDEMTYLSALGAIAIVPGFTFDEEGNRVGYGGGFYDTFLSEHGMVSVGLCREEQMSEDLRGQGLVDEHDEAVAYVVTERRTIECARERMAQDMQEEKRMERTIAFKDMPYFRPDLVGLKNHYDALTASLTAATDYDQVRSIFLEHDALERHTDTMRNLAYMRHSIDTRDEFYTAENDFWDEAVPELQACAHEWTKALLAHPLRPELEAEFGALLFTDAEIELRTFDPAIISEMQQENKLTSEYARLIASAQIPFQGKTYTLSQLTPFKTDADDELRKSAWIAEGCWYKEHQADLDRIYDELVHLRDAMGKKLGHDSYIPLGYDRMSRNCYDRDDVERFREAVRTHLVPLCERIYRDQAERIGAPWPLSFADEALMYRSGNPRPAGGADDILAAGRTFYDELSPETSEYFRMMLDRGMLDVLSTEGKEGGGYCETLLDYHVPFIFANFNGTQHDVEVITHEAGHGFAAWLNIDRVPCSYVWPSNEACEVHSMSMEFFAWPWARGFFGDDERKYLYSHLAGAVTFIPYGTMVDHFQHLVYERPEMSPAERHAVWKELLGVYMPWLALDGEIPFYAEGEGWQRQMHIYEVPFYYIDYCLAQTVALSFWAQIQEDQQAAWERYLAYSKMGGSKTFTELLAEAGLASPFDEACLRGICEKASSWLDDYDLTGLE